MLHTPRSFFPGDAIDDRDMRRSLEYIQPSAATLSISARRRTFGCLVAGRFLLSAILIATGTVKLWGFDHHMAWRSIGLGVLATAEIYAGTALAFGAFGFGLVRVLLAAFSAFLAWNLYQVATGSATCGCFGDLRVPPWLAACLDLSILIFLVAVCRRGEQVAKVSLLRTGQVAVVSLAVTVLISTVADTRRAVRGGNGDVALESYLRGDWIIILHRPGCRKCEEVIDNYRHLALDLSEAAPTFRIGFADVTDPRLSHVIAQLKGPSILNTSEGSGVPAPAVMMVVNGVTRKAWTDDVPVSMEELFAARR